MTMRFQQDQRVGRQAQMEQAVLGPQRPSTSASKASAKRTVLPGLGLLLARKCAHTSRVPGSRRSIKASTLPPLAFWP